MGLSARMSKALGCYSHRGAGSPRTLGGREDDRVSENSTSHGFSRGTVPARFPKALRCYNHRGASSPRKLGGREDDVVSENPREHEDDLVSDYPTSPGSSSVSSSAGTEDSWAGSDGLAALAASTTSVAPQDGEPVEAATAPVAAMGAAEEDPTDRAEQASPACASLPSLPRLMSQTTFARADAVPDGHAAQFSKKVPVFCTDLPGMTLEAIEAALKATPFIMETCFEQDIKAYDIQPSRWEPSRSAGDSMIRCVKYRMPIPDDVPSAARSIINIPEFAVCQTYCRLQCAAQEINLTFQTDLEGLPFADNVQLQVTDSYMPYCNGTSSGVTFRRRVNIIWIKELPWTIRFLKSFVASKTTSAAREAAGILVRLLGDVAGPACKTLAS